MPDTPTFPLGSHVEYVGEDIPELLVWRGHPGRVVDTPPFDPEEAGVGLVGGPTMSFAVELLRSLDDASYRARGERVIAGSHPLEERETRGPLTADGSHWP
jgi:hypothetical protein